ncbi:MAG: DJ-1/PfpI family protein [Nitrospinaceae bacterium]
MGELTGKNILMVIPKNQFCEEELFITRSHLESAGARTVILSPSGREAAGMKKNRFQPHGMVIDWNRQQGITGKYGAVLVTGGKGSPKSLWNDPILPQILTDHYRAGKIVGAIGLSVAVLAKASLLKGLAAGPDQEAFLKTLDDCGIQHVDDPVTRDDRIITARGAEAAVQFAETVVKVFAEQNEP